MSTIDAIVLGGGIGRRFSEASQGPTALPKQFRVLHRAPLFIHTLRSISQLDGLRQILLVMPAHYRELAETMLREHWKGSLPVRVITGGERRQDSSRIALEHLDAENPAPTRVLIHDACRPHISTALAERITKAIQDRSYGAWIPVVPTTDTLKHVENNQVSETVDRSRIFAVQTPQIFEYSVLRSLVDRTDIQDVHFTDDASLCEYYGIPVGVFEGDVRNLKLTYDYELTTLTTLLDMPQEKKCAPVSASISIG